MNTDTTARRVLLWAARPEAAPLPSGPLRSASGLAHLTTATASALAELVRATAARMGAGSPPFGDRSAVGPGAVLLAAAIGGRAQPEPARLLAGAVRPPRLAVTGWADALARHAVLAPALAQVAGEPTVEDHEPLVDAMLHCSPLTAVLHRPPSSALARGATGSPVATARTLLGRPHGIDVLQAALSGFVADAAVLGWRTELLGRFAIDHPAFVVDAYVAARLRHGRQWDTAVTSARRALAGLGVPDELSLATLRFWLPLARLGRSRPDLLRDRPLMTGHREVLGIVEGRHRASIAGAA